MAKAATAEKFELDVIDHHDLEGPEGEPSNLELLEAEQWLDHLEVPDQEKMLERLHALKDWHEELLADQADGLDIRSGRREFARDMATFAADAVDVCGPMELGEFFYHVERLVSSLEFRG